LANASDLSVTASLQADERKWSVLSAEEVFASVLVVVRDDGSPAQHARLMHGNPLLMAPCPGCRLQTVNFLGLLFNKRFDFGQLFFRHHQVDLFSLVFSTLFSYGGKLILQGPHGQL
ncbi:hypothetical protein T03_2479, partial [Trichinella britovi]